MTKEATDHPAVGHPIATPLEAACPLWCAAGPHEWMQDGDDHFLWHVSAPLEASGAPWSVMVYGMDTWTEGILGRHEPLILADKDDEVLTLRQNAEFIADQARAQALALS